MKKITLLLILMTIPEWAVASNGNPTHTHTNTPIELEFVSSNLGTKYAAVCFLGGDNCGDGSFAKGDNDMGIDTRDQCQNEGYIYSSDNCTLPKFLEGKCPYNSAYYSECKQNIPRACKEAGYILVSQCVSGQKLKKSPRCPWDDSYGICCKESCPVNSSLNCSGASAGDDTCGYTCKQCCSNACPSGSYEYRSGSGGCGGSTTQNGCKTKTCYYPYSSCPCSPSCSGTESSSSCPPDYYYYEKSDGCGGICSGCDCATSWQNVGSPYESCDAAEWQCKGAWMCQTQWLINCHGGSYGERTSCTCHSNWKRNC